MFNISMFRKNLIELLLNHPMSISELAILLQVPPNDVEDDLRHLLKTLKNSPYRALITPAQCKKCGFVFHKDKLSKPGKCPQCKGTWIREPHIAIEMV